MGVKYQDKIDVFYGGMPDDIRQQDPELSMISSHLDIWTNPKRLVPFRNMEPDEVTSYNINNFVYTNSQIYGLGVVSATSRVKIYKKTSGDSIGGTWTEYAPTGAEDSGGARSANAFTAFHDYVYGLTAGSRIWACGPISGSATFTATALSLTSFTSTCRGIVTVDDLYLQPYDNKIAVKDGAGSGPTNAWDLARLTVPDYFIIPDLVEFGDKAAIACQPKSQQGNSKVAIWDKIDSDPDYWVDFGEGNLQLIDEVEGELIGILTVAGTSAFGIRPKLVIRKWSGGSKAVVDFELEGDENTTIIVYGNQTKVKDSNRIIFGIQITIDGITYTQMAAVGRKSTDYPLTFSLDRLVDNDTALTAGINGAIKLGNYFFIAHNTDGSINRTNDQAVYTNCTPIYITNRINGSRYKPDAARWTKKLTFAGVLCKPLTSGQSIVLQYRCDASASWVTISTLNTIGLDYLEVGTEADGTDFSNCKEFQFKMTPLGGAQPTALIYGLEIEEADVDTGD